MAAVTLDTMCSNLVVRNHVQLSLKKAWRTNAMPIIKRYASGVAHVSSAGKLLAVIKERDVQLALVNDVVEGTVNVKSVDGKAVSLQVSVDTKATTAKKTTAKTVSWKEAYDAVSLYIYGATLAGIVMLSLLK